MSNTQLMDRHIRDFFSQTTLHGLKYLYRKKSNQFEKIFWTISLLVSIILTILMISKLLQNYLNNPIVIYNDKYEYSLSDFYFPSITICPTLIFNTRTIKTVNYKAITKALSSNEISINNLTMEE
jgi:acid-sensing ion channel, other